MVQGVLTGGFVEWAGVFLRDFQADMEKTANTERERRESATFTLENMFSGFESRIATHEPQTKSTRDVWQQTLVASGAEPGAKGVTLYAMETAWAPGERRREGLHTIAAHAVVLTPADFRLDLMWRVSLLRAACACADIVRYIGA